jgi:flagellar biogenesis protein FliO
MNQIPHFEFILRRFERRGVALAKLMLSNWAKLLLGAWISQTIAAQCTAQVSSPEFRTLLHESALDRQQTWQPPPIYAAPRSNPTTNVDATHDPSSNSSIASFETNASLSGNSDSGSIEQAKNWLAAKCGKWFGNSNQAGGGPDYKRILGALGIVLGGYFALVWLLRFISPAVNTHLPRDVFEVLGKTGFGNRQHLQLVRLGNKLLLLLESAEGIQPIAEVTDPAEVEHLVDLCDPQARRRKNRHAGRRGAEPSSPQAYSFRIPALNNASSVVSHPSDRSEHLANILRVVENASRNEKKSYRSSYEA